MGAPSDKKGKLQDTITPKISPVWVARPCNGLYVQARASQSTLTRSFHRMSDSERLRLLKVQ